MVRAKDRPLQPMEAASAILREHKGDRRVAETLAWKQFESFRESEGDDSMAARYWMTVAACIADRTENPPVEDAVRPPPPW